MLRRDKVRKIIGLLLVILFLVEQVVPASAYVNYADDAVSSLQVQSRFKPIAEAGIRVSFNLRAQIFSALRMASRGEDARCINDILNASGSQYNVGQSVNVIGVKQASQEDKTIILCEIQQRGKSAYFVVSYSENQDEPLSGELTIRRVADSDVQDRISEFIGTLPRKPLAEALSQIIENGAYKDTFETSNVYWDVGPGEVPTVRISQDGALEIHPQFARDYQDIQARGIFIRPDTFSPGRPDLHIPRDNFLEESLIYEVAPPTNENWTDPLGVPNLLWRKAVWLWYRYSYRSRYLDGINRTDNRQFEKYLNWMFVSDEDWAKKARAAFPGLTRNENLRKKAIRWALQINKLYFIDDQTPGVDNQPAWVETTARSRELELASSRRSSRGISDLSGKELWEKIKAGDPELDAFMKRPRRGLPFNLTFGARLVFEGVAIVFPKRVLRTTLNKEFYIVRSITEGARKPYDVYYNFPDEMLMKIKDYVLSHPGRRMAKFTRPPRELGRFPAPVPLLRKRFWLNYYKNPLQEVVEFNQIGYRLVAERLSSYIKREYRQKGKRAFSILHGGSGDARLLRLIQQELRELRKRLPGLKFHLYGVDKYAADLSGEIDESDLTIRQGLAQSPGVFGPEKDENFYDYIIDYGLLTKGAVSGRVAKAIVRRWRKALKPDGCIFSVPYADILIDEDEMRDMGFVTLARSLPKEIFSTKRTGGKRPNQFYTFQLARSTTKPGAKPGAAKGPAEKPARRQSPRGLEACGVTRRFRDMRWTDAAIIFYDEPYSSKDGALIWDAVTILPSQRQQYSSYILKGANVDRVGQSAIIYETFAHAFSKLLQERIWKVLDQQLEPGSKALDVGCGSGIFMQGFTPEQRARICGLDYMGALLRKLKERVPEVETIECDWLFMDRKIEEGSFGACIGFDSLTNTNDIEELTILLRQIDRALKFQNGKKCIIHQFFSCPSSKKYWYGKDYFADAEPLGFFDHDVASSEEWYEAYHKIAPQVWANFKEALLRELRALGYELEWIEEPVEVEVPISELNSEQKGFLEDSQLPDGKKPNVLHYDRGLSIETRFDPTVKPQHCKQIIDSHTLVATKQQEESTAPSPEVPGRRSSRGLEACGITRRFRDMKWNNATFTFSGNPYKNREGALVQKAVIALPSGSMSVGEELLKGTFVGNTNIEENLYRTFPHAFPKLFQEKAWGVIEPTLEPGSKVLDLGCGRGIFMQGYTQGQRARTIGLDYMNILLRRLRERFPEVETVECDWLEMDRKVEEGSFGACIGINGLHSTRDIEDLARLLGQIDRALKYQNGEKRIVHQFASAPPCMKYWYGKDFFVDAEQMGYFDYPAGSLDWYTRAYTKLAPQTWTNYKEALFRELKSLGYASTWIEDFVEVEVPISELGPAQRECLGVSLPGGKKPNLLRIRVNSFPEVGHDPSVKPGYLKEVIGICTLVATKRQEESTAPSPETSGRQSPRGLEACGVTRKHEDMTWNSAEIIFRGTPYKGRDGALLRETVTTLPSERCLESAEMLKGTYIDLAQRNVLTYETFIHAFSKLFQERTWHALESILEPDSKALDLGCGNGIYMQAYTPEQRARTCGLDYMAVLLQWLNERFPEVETIACDWLEMDQEIEEGTFGACIGINSLHSTLDIDQLAILLSQIDRALKFQNGRKRIVHQFTTVPAHLKYWYGRDYFVDAEPMGFFDHQEAQSTEWFEAYYGLASQVWANYKEALFEELGTLGYEVEWIEEPVEVEVPFSELNPVQRASLEEALPDGTRPNVLHRIMGLYSTAEYDPTVKPGHCKQIINAYTLIATKRQEESTAPSLEASGRQSSRGLEACGITKRFRDMRWTNAEFAFQGMPFNSKEGALFRKAVITLPSRKRLIRNMPLKGTSVELAERGLITFATFPHALSRLLQERMWEIFEPQLEPDSRALDLGCGSGVFFQGYTPKQRARTTGLDYMGSLLRILQSRFPEVETVECDWLQMDQKIEEGSFGACIGVDSLHCTMDIRELATLLGQIDRALKFQNGKKYIIHQFGSVPPVIEYWYGKDFYVAAEALGFYVNPPMSREWFEAYNQLAPQVWSNYKQALYAELKSLGYEVKWIEEPFILEVPESRMTRQQREFLRGKTVGGKKVNVFYYTIGSYATAMHDSRVKPGHFWQVVEMRTLIATKRQEDSRAPPISANRRSSRGFEASGVKRRFSGMRWRNAKVTPEGTAYRTRDGALVQNFLITLPSQRQVMSTQALKGTAIRLADRSAIAYETIAHAFPKLFQERTWGVLEPQLEPDSKVLELGCGDGVYMKYYTPEQRARTSGLDYMGALLQRLKKRFPEVETIECDWLEMDGKVERGAFGACIGINSLHSTRDLKELATLLRQINRALKFQKGRKRIVHQFTSYPANLLYWYGRDFFEDAEGMGFFDHREGSKAWIEAYEKLAPQAWANYREAMTKELRSLGYEVEWIEEPVEVDVPLSELSRRERKPLKKRLFGGYEHNLLHHGMGMHTEATYNTTVQPGHCRQVVDVSTLIATKKQEDSEAQPVTSAQPEVTRRQSPRGLEASGVTRRFRDMRWTNAEVKYRGMPYNDDNGALIRHVVTTLPSKRKQGSRSILKGTLTHKSKQDRRLFEIRTQVFRKLLQERGWKVFESQLEPGSKVLDLGCGSGIFIQAYTPEQRVKTVGLDYMRILLERLREQFPEVETIECDWLMMDQKVAEGSFGASIGVNSLHSTRDIKDLAKLLRQIDRALKFQNGKKWIVHQFTTMPRNMEYWYGKDFFVDAEPMGFFDYPEDSDVWNEAFRAFAPRVWSNYKEALFEELESLGYEVEWIEEPLEIEVPFSQLSRRQRDILEESKLPDGKITNLVRYDMAWVGTGWHDPTVRPGHCKFTLEAYTLIATKKQEDSEAQPVTSAQPVETHRQSPRGLEACGVTRRFRDMRWTNAEWRYDDMPYKDDDGALVRDVAITLPSRKLYVAAEVLKGTSVDSVERDEIVYEVFSHVIPGAIQKRTWRAIEPHLEPDSRVLDLGCGSGIYIQGHTPEQRARTTGLDYMGVLLQRLRSEFPEVETIECDWLMMDQEIEEGTFGACIGVNSLHSTRDMEALAKLLRQIDRVLKFQDGKKRIVHQFTSVPGSREYWYGRDFFVDAERLGYYANPMDSKEWYEAYYRLAPQVWENYKEALFAELRYLGYEVDWYEESLGVDVPLSERNRRQKRLLKARLPDGKRPNSIHQPMGLCAVPDYHKGVRPGHFMEVIDIYTLVATKRQEDSAEPSGQRKSSRGIKACGITERFKDMRWTNAALRFDGMPYKDSNGALLRNAVTVLPSGMELPSFELLKGAFLQYAKRDEEAYEHLTQLFRKLIRERTWGVFESQLEPDSKVLNLGCGSGIYMQAYTPKQRARTCGLDYMAVLLQGLKSRFPEVEAVECDWLMMDRKIDEGTFGACVGVNSLHATRDIKGLATLLQQIDRVLKYQNGKKWIVHHFVSVPSHMKYWYGKDYFVDAERMGFFDHLEEGPEWSEVYKTLASQVWANYKEALFDELRSLGYEAEWIEKSVEVVVPISELNRQQRQSLKKRLPDGKHPNVMRHAMATVGMGEYDPGVKSGYCKLILDVYTLVATKRQEDSAEPSGQRRSSSVQRSSSRGIDAYGITRRFRDMRWTDAAVRFDGMPYKARDGGLVRDCVFTLPSQGQYMRTEVLKGTSIQLAALDEHVYGSFAHAFPKLLQEKTWNVIEPQLEPGSKVLDLGCGSGVFMQAYTPEQRAKTCGLDYMEVLLRRLKGQHPEVEAIECDWLRMDQKIDEGAFGACIGINGLHSTRDIRELETLLRQIDRVLKFQNGKKWIVHQFTTNPSHMKYWYGKDFFVDAERMGYFNYPEGRSKEWFEVVYALAPQVRANYKKALLEELESLGYEIKWTQGFVEVEVPVSELRREQRNFLKKRLPDGKKPNVLQHTMMTFDTRAYDPNVKPGHVKEMIEVITLVATKRQEATAGDEDRSPQDATARRSATGSREALGMSGGDIGILTYEEKGIGQTGRLITDLQSQTRDFLTSLVSGDVLRLMSRNDDIHRFKLLETPRRYSYQGQLRSLLSTHFFAKAVDLTTRKVVIIKFVTPGDEMDIIDRLVDTDVAGGETYHDAPRPGVSNRCIVFDFIDSADFTIERYFESLTQKPLYEILLGVIDKVIQLAELVGEAEEHDIQYQGARRHILIDRNGYVRLMDFHDSAKVEYDKARLSDAHIRFLSGILIGGLLGIHSSPAEAALSDRHHLALVIELFNVSEGCGTVAEFIDRLKRVKDKIPHIREFTIDDDIDPSTGEPRIVTPTEEVPRGWVNDAIDAIERSSWPPKTLENAAAWLLNRLNDEKIVIDKRVLSRIMFARNLGSASRAHITEDGELVILIDQSFKTVFDDTNVNLRGPDRRKNWTTLVRLLASFLIHEAVEFINEPISKWRLGQADPNIVNTEFAAYLVQIRYLRKYPDFISNLRDLLSHQAQHSLPGLYRLFERLWNVEPRAFTEQWEVVIGPILDHLEEIGFENASMRYHRDDRGDKPGARTFSSGRDWSRVRRVFTLLLRKGLMSGSGRQAEPQVAGQVKDTPRRASARGEEHNVHELIELAFDDRTKVGEFLRERAALPDTPDCEHFEATEPSDELYAFLGLPERSDDLDVRSMRAWIKKYFDRVPRKRARIFAEKTTVGGNEYIWLFYVPKTSHAESPYYDELYYLNKRRIAHGASEIGKRFITMEMGLGPSAQHLKGQEHMKILFNMKQGFLRRKFDRVVALKVPDYEVNNWRTFFFYVRKGYLPVDAWSRNKILETFLVPWRENPGYAVRRPYDEFSPMVPLVQGGFMLYLRDPRGSVNDSYASRPKPEPDSKGRSSARGSADDEAYAEAYAARAREIYMRVDGDFVRQVESVFSRGKYTFSELFAELFYEFYQTTSPEKAHEELVDYFLEPGIDIQHIEDHIQRMLDFAESAVSNPQAAEFVTALGQLRAIRIIEPAERKGNLDRKIPGNVNPDPEANQKPYYDWCSGTGAVAYFKNLARDRKYVFADRAHYVVGFLEKAKEILGLGDNIEILREDIFDLDLVPGSIGTLRLSNIGAYANIEGRPLSWYEEIEKSIVPGGQIIVEALTSRDSILSNHPIAQNLWRVTGISEGAGEALKSHPKGAGWISEVGYFDNDGHYTRVDKGYGGRKPPAGVRVTHVFTKQSQRTPPGTPDRRHSPSGATGIGYRDEGPKVELIGPDDRLSVNEILDTEFELIKAMRALNRGLGIQPISDDQNIDMLPSKDIIIPREFIESQQPTATLANKRLRSVLINGKVHAIIVKPLADIEAELSSGFYTKKVNGDVEKLPFNHENAIAILEPDVIKEIAESLGPKGAVRCSFLPVRLPRDGAEFYFIIPAVVKLAIGVDAVLFGKKYELLEPVKALYKAISGSDRAIDINEVQNLPLDPVKYADLLIKIFELTLPKCQPVINDLPELRKMEKAILMAA